jgi:hypothetical protein
MKKMENKFGKTAHRTSKVQKNLFTLVLVLIIINLAHGLISPETFVSMVGEEVIVIEFGILIWGLIIGSLVALINFENFPYKIRFRFWFMIFICLQNVFYIFLNITEYMRIQSLQ